MHKIYLKNILELKKKQKKEILKIRNSTYVASKMYSSKQITYEEHFTWMENLKYNKKKYVFAVINEDKIFGMLSLNNINWEKKIAEWAFYVAEKNIYGLGAALEFNFIDYVIIKNNFKKLNCEILESNYKIIKFHKKFFFKTKETIKYVIKDNQKTKIISMTLSAKEWRMNRIFIKNRYSKIIDNFHIIIDEFNPMNLKT
jgi:UDP-4-amino-4,6-dideoxy-N-acetyl-beta-L-altrosamine N-acetyltransferase